MSISLKKHHKNISSLQRFVAKRKDKYDDESYEKASKKAQIAKKMGKK